MELLRHVTIGSYLPGNSVAHRLDPRLKAGLLIMGMTAVFCVASLGSLLLLLGLCLLAARLAAIGVGFFLGGLRVVAPLLLFTFVFNAALVHGGAPLLSLGGWTLWQAGVNAALVMSLRLVLLLLLTSLYTLTTSPVRITDAIESLLSPLRFIGVPAAEIAMMMSIALRFIPTLVDATEKIMKAQMARGARFSEGGLLSRARGLLPVLVPLFVHAFRSAEELAIAMEARCYRGGSHRTRLVSLRCGPLDLSAAVLVGTLLATICWTDACWPRALLLT
jgi:energy-coupling factor transport system permease protein